MEEAGVFEVSGFTFTSNFDSGNLAHVELSSVGADSEPECPAVSRPSTSTAQPRCAGPEAADYDFLLWTRPDCHRTEFENGNRTWFYFGLKGGPPGAVVRFTVMNMNKQSKLFSQGMAPVFMIPGLTAWDRIRDQPTFSTNENNFSMSFKFRNLEEPSYQVFFAFTYPYSYKELQSSLAKLEKKHSSTHLSWETLQSVPDSGVYFHRELAARSLENRRLDLITITGLNNIQKEREPTLARLFPDQDPAKRPHKFSNKKTVFLSARVHPGETCSSFVMNGFIRFILSQNDARAAALRAKYVFKLVPMLNPDGVYRGHYRTDTRGVNLNRVYLDPSPVHHPTIYAAKRLILLAHLGVAPPEDSVSSVDLVTVGGVDTEEVHNTEENPELSDTPDDSGSGVNLPTCSHLSEPELYKPLTLWDISKNSSATRGRTSGSSRSSQGPGSTPGKGEMALQWYEMTETSRCSEGDESVADFSIGPSFGIGALLGSVVETNKCDDSDAFLPPEVPTSPAKRSRYGRTSFAGVFQTDCLTSPEVKVRDKNCNVATEISPTETVDFESVPIFKPPTGESGLFLYVDIHGHASKRGIFMYGNHFEELETKVSALLYPKIMSINSANFDFPACNFTARNMYMKDRHTGAGKEGSGRVSIYKATGLTYCYTLECNFNTGRFTNSVPLSSRDCGRASPPPIYDHPPKYCPDIYDQCGRYMAISILDLTESNPWTRLPCSQSKTLKGVRTWIKQWLKTAEAEAASKSSKNSKFSPMKTRLRSVSASKKSPFKQLLKSQQLFRSPSSPEIAGSSSSHQSKPLSKQTRKAISPKHSQSVASSSGRLSRQNSRTNSNRTVETSKKKKRIGSGKKLKSKVANKSNPRINSKPNSVSGSRSSSPKRNKSETKSKSKISQKKTLQKAAWNSLQDPANADKVMMSGKKVKRTKKKSTVSAS